MAAVMIGVDPHKGSHTAVAISAAEEPLGELRVRASLPGGAAAGVGGGVAAADLGGRGRRRAGSPAGPAARPRVSGCWTCRPSWRAGPAAGRRGHEQERPERCPVGGGRRAAVGRRPEAGR